MPLSQLISVLQAAIGPVILISGVGLWVLSMTNRLGRTIDRSRELAALQHSAAPQERERNDAQLKILWRRALLLRTAIALATLSALLAAALVIVLFVSALLGLQITLLVATLFIACLCSMIASLVYFILDIDMSLRALETEIGSHLNGGS